MLKHLTKVIKDWSAYLIIGFVSYLFVATWTFAFRHPWTTDVERLIHIGDALVFKKISYNEMRKNYEK